MKERAFPKPLPSSGSGSLDDATPTTSSSDSSQFVFIIIVITQIICCYNCRPMNGISVRLIGKLDKTHKLISEEIKSLGGTVTTAASPLTRVCISNQLCIDKMEKAMKDMKKSNIPVVTMEYLNDIMTNGGSPYDKIATHKISTWGDSMPGTSSSKFEKGLTD